MSSGPQRQPLGFFTLPGEVKMLLNLQRPLRKMLQAQEAAAGA